MMKRIISLVALATSVAIARPSAALDIRLTYVPEGSNIPGMNVKNLGPDANFCHPNAGIYNAWFAALVVQAAADYWETIYTYPGGDILNISWGFLDTSSFDSPLHAAKARVILPLSSFGVPTNGSIAFNRNKPNDGFYIDHDPATWNEYPSGGRVTSSNIPYHNRPGQYVEDGRYTDVSTLGDTRWTDLYTTALHEIGHLLGMSQGVPRYVNEVADGDIDVTPWRPIPGLAWMSSGGHLTYSSPTFHALMTNRSQAGRRKWPSQADISCISQISGWWVGSWGLGGGGVQGLAANNPPN